jgi:ABC-type Na+ transport system ATPase subunit NatA
MIHQSYPHAFSLLRAMNGASKHIALANSVMHDHDVLMFVVVCIRLDVLALQHLY